MDAAGRTLSGLDKHDIDWTLADAGRDSFQKYWPQIIDRIEAWNLDVTLTVMTVYNPYHTTDVYKGTNYYNKADPYFSADDGDDPGLNHIIRNLMTLDNAITGRLTSLLTILITAWRMSTRRSTPMVTASTTRMPLRGSTGPSVIPIPTRWVRISFTHSTRSFSVTSSKDESSTDSPAGCQ